MASTYRAVVLKGKGGLDQLEVRELPIPEPAPGEARIRVRAAGAGATDITMRSGYYPFRPPFPFTVGYEVVGEIDALGQGVTGLSVGQRVCALTVHGAQAEVLVRGAEHFVPVPDGLDDNEVVALILNYVTAYQMIHRAAAMRAGQTALVSGASGGVGTAALELFRAAGIRAIGAASKRHFDLVRELGGEPIESRDQPLDEATHAILPEGVDAAFDNLGGARTREHVCATKRGGIVVGFGFMATGASTLATLRGFASLFVGARLAGRRSTFYGITKIYNDDPRSFREDLPKLFELLAARAIQPKIAAVLPLLDGRRAQEMLVRGGVAGKIVLSRDAR
jgi:NADPH:quinone reductase-like Zn-dependent oxidoreductase